LEGQNLSGQLSDWSISDLLQIMHVTKKTGSLDISGERGGQIHFKEGAVVGADLTAARLGSVADSKAAIADILYVLSSLDSGSFAVVGGEPPVDVKGWSVEDILSDVEVLRTLESEVAETGLLDAVGVQLRGDGGEPITLQPEDWQVIAELVRPFTFDELESRFGRGGAVRVLHTLHRLEVAEPLANDEDGESDWLDRLAGGISGDPSTSPLVDDGQPAAKHLASDDDSPGDGEGESTPGNDDVIDPAAAATGPIREQELEPVLQGSVEIRGVSAPASTTLTDGVYDEIRRLRSKVADK